MKKIVLLIIILLGFSSIYSQGTQLDFSMQFQNTNNHDAVIYPNPITSPSFKVKSYSVITDIQIMDMVGKVIYSKNVESYSNQEILINMPQCNKGVYMVKIIFDDSETVIKKLLYQ